MNELERRTIFAEVMETFYRGELRDGSTGLVITDVQKAKAVAARKMREGTLKPPAGGRTHGGEQEEGEEDPQGR